MTVLWLPALKGDGPTAVGRAAERTYVVRPGDTVWEIAARATHGEDPRPYVDAIVGGNRLVTERLVPGQTLVLPSPG